METQTRTPPKPHKTDRVLVVLLLLLNLGSAYTTVIGARQILPWPMSDVLGLAVQTMLFLMLAGATARHAPIRKWLVVAVFAVASIYTSFFAYYDQLAGQASAAEAHEQAAQAHAAFVSAIYQPATTRLARLEEGARAQHDLAEREGSAGLTTGRVGFGPVARAYTEEALRLERESALLRADLTHLAARFEYNADALPPKAIHARDLAAWQRAPDDWKSAVPAPTRADYIDVEQDVALLAPFHKLGRGELPAVLALLLALLVDGIAVLLGTAIDSSGRPLSERWSEQLTTTIRRTKNGTATVREALQRPGQVPDGPTREEAHALEDPLRVVVLRVEGRGSDFLTAFYQSIHPETGSFDFARLQTHQNPTYRIAARMLADRLRRARLGWVLVHDGWWTVPEEHYARLTFWLGEQIRRECESELESSPEEAERTLKLVLPASAA